MLAIAYLLVPTSPQSVGGILFITLSNSVVQSSSDYTFTIDFYYNDPFVIGTIIQINFPLQYISNSTTSYACELTVWPFSVPDPVSCQITNRVLTLTGAFPQEFNVTQDTAF